MKKLVLILLLTGCGGSQQQSASAVYATALRLAKRMCVVVDALPDPPAETSGGEATP